MERQYFPGNPRSKNIIIDNGQRLNKQKNDITNFPPSLDYQTVKSITNWFAYKKCLKSRYAYRKLEKKSLEIWNWQKSTEMLTEIGWILGKYWHKLEKSSIKGWKKIKATFSW